MTENVDISGRIIRGQDGETFIIHKEKYNTVSGIFDSHVYPIPEKTFGVVEKIVNMFREKKIVNMFLVRLDYLTQNGPNEGCFYLWERNFHDKIVDFIFLMNPELDKMEISNSLSALGF